MFQKLNPKPRAQMRAFDQPRQIGHSIRLLMRPLAHRHHAQIRLQRRKGVVRNLRFRRRKPRDQRRFPDIRIPNQPGIGQQLQLQPVAAFFPGASQFMLSRSLVRAGSKVLIAAPTAAALGNDDGLVRVREVMHQLAGHVVDRAACLREPSGWWTRPRSPSSWSPAHGRRAAPYAPG